LGEGFFLLTQRIKGFKAGRWVLEKEVIPYNPQNFSQEYQREFDESRGSHLPPKSEDPGHLFRTL